MKDGDRMLKLLESYAAREEWDKWVEVLGPYSDAREEEGDLDEALLARNVDRVEDDRLMLKYPAINAEWVGGMMDLGFELLGIKSLVFCSRSRPGHLFITNRISINGGWPVISKPQLVEEIKLAMRVAQIGKYID